MEGDKGDAGLGSGRGGGDIQGGTLEETDREQMYTINRDMKTRGEREAPGTETGLHADIMTQKIKFLIAIICMTFSHKIKISSQ